MAYGLRGCMPPSQALTSITSREVNEARGGLILATGRVRSKKKNRKRKKQEQIRPIQNIPRKPQQPGDSDHLETVHEKPRPMR